MLLGVLVSARSRKNWPKARHGFSSDRLTWTQKCPVGLVFFCLGVTIFITTRLMPNSKRLQSKGNRSERFQKFGAEGGQMQLASKPKGSWNENSLV